MTQRVKATVAKSDSLNLISRTPIVEERADSQKLPSNRVHTSTLLAHTHLHSPRHIIDK